MHHDDSIPTTSASAASSQKSIQPVLYQPLHPRHRELPQIAARARKTCSAAPASSALSRQALDLVTTSSRAHCYQGPSIIASAPAAPKTPGSSVKRNDATEARQCLGSPRPAGVLLRLLGSRLVHRLAARRPRRRRRGSKLEEQRARERERGQGSRQKS